MDNQRLESLVCRFQGHFYYQWRNEQRYTKQRITSTVFSPVVVAEISVDVHCSERWHRSLVAWFWWSSVVSGRVHLSTRQVQTTRSPSLKYVWNGVYSYDRVMWVPTLASSASLASHVLDQMLKEHWRRNHHSVIDKQWKLIDAMSALFAGEDSAVTHATR